MNVPKTHDLYKWFVNVKLEISKVVKKKKIYFDPKGPH